MFILRLANTLQLPSVYDMCMNILRNRIYTIMLYIINNTYIFSANLDKKTQQQ